MPLGLVKKALDLLKGRKKMGSKRKKLKKLHYRDPDVSPESVAGTMRAKNAETKRQIDEAGNY